MKIGTFIQGLLIVFCLLIFGFLVLGPRAPRETTLPLSDSSSHPKPCPVVDHWQIAQTQTDYFCSRIFPTLQSNLPALFKVRDDVKIDGSDNFSFFCFAQNDVVCKHVFKQAAGWDAPKLKEMLGHLKKVSEAKKVPKEKVTFLDVGTNVGWFSANIAVAGFKVISFEPMVQNEVLVRLNQCAGSQEVRDRWIFFNKGLGAKATSCVVFSGNNNLGDGISQCDPPPGWKVPEGYSVRGRIDVVKLDDYITKSDIEDMEVGLVKIDVEGFEGEVVKGARQFFANPRIKYVVMEYWKRQGKLTEGHQAAYDILLELGFKASISFTERVHMGPTELFPGKEDTIGDIFYWRD